MIISIESSCDDSAIAITEIKTKKLLFHKRVSQIKEHTKYGGVVPELAARLHTEVLPELIDYIKPFIKNLKIVVVTNEPGLVVSLIEGVSAAKAICIALDIPIIPINHIKGHIYSVFIEKESDFPLISLVMSGGHTQIFNVNTYDNMTLIASTLDDSIGESFDKVAKMLGLCYPGGPEIEKKAKSGNENKFNFTVPLTQKPDIAFSYSGIKNQVRLAIEAGDLNNDEFIADICASFQKVAFEHIFFMLKRYKKRYGLEKLAIVGGVSANLYFKQKLQNWAKKESIKLFFAQLQFCSDNAAMIGRAGIEAYRLKLQKSLDTIAINSRVDWS